MKRLTCLDMKLGLIIDCRTEWQNHLKMSALMYESLISKLQKAAEIEKKELANR